jgi:hypothetical protein
MPPVGDDFPDLTAVGRLDQAELRLPASGLVDPQVRHRRRVLRQRSLGRGRERGVRHRPRHLEVARGLHHRPSAVGDRFPDRGTQPRRQPRPRWDRRQRLGERLAPALLVDAPPSALGPGQTGSPPGHGQVPRTSAYPGVRPPGPHPTVGTASGLLIAGDQGQHRNVVGADLDAGHLHPDQAEQPRRIVGQARGPSRDPSSVATRRITERHGRSAPVKTLTADRAHRARLSSKTLQRMAVACVTGCGLPALMAGCWIEPVN